jgi:hypothetical protein
MCEGWGEGTEPSPKSVSDYLAMTENGTLLDPDLSRHVGVALQGGCFLVWMSISGTIETQGDDTLAKAGIRHGAEMRARTGRIMWKADHCATK